MCNNCSTESELTNPARRVMLVSEIASSQRTHMNLLSPKHHQGGRKPWLIKMTLFGLYLISYQPHLSFFESF
jgi:hypothetical protein